jgi:hypothetical protein
MPFENRCIHIIARRVTLQICKDMDDTINMYTVDRWGWIVVLAVEHSDWVLYNVTFVDC